jgi:hypothetical protein
MIKSLIQLGGIFLFVLLALYFDQPPAVESADSSSFSAIRAMQHIEKIADKSHFMGSPANKEKRDYIIEEFKKLGYNPTIYTGEAQNSWGSNRIFKGKTENILITKPGRKSNKTVVVMGHYDSVMDSPGAADDVHSIASMLEVAALIKDEVFDNDILFLVTDGEEMGLFGARAYAENHDLSSIGVLLNFEARGNSGPSYAFEWSENNYELVKAFKSAVPKPIANSMSFEVYNRMPNGSDFTIFKDQGVAGINHAFIDGFSYYHSPEDKPENINLKSVQHHGDYMYNLVRYFGNADLSFKEESNATFFNFYAIFVVYPSGWDLLFIIMTGLFTFLLIGRWMKKKKVKFTRFLGALGGMLMTIIIAYFIGIGLEWLVKTIYPHYFQFYVGQFYNHKSYLLLIVGLSILIQCLFGKKIYQLVGRETYFSAVLLLWLVFAISVYSVASTATYLFVWPLIAVSSFLLWMEYFPKLQLKSWAFLTYLIPGLIVIGFWTIVIHSLFLAFSLEMLELTLAMLVLVMLLLPAFVPELWKNIKLLTSVGVVIVLIASTYGCFTSTPTSNRPLPAHLDYIVNQNDSMAYWASLDKVLSEGNIAWLENAKLKEINLPWQVKRWVLEASEKVFNPIEITSDSTNTTTKKLTVVNNSLQTILYLPGTDRVEGVYFNEEKVYSSTDDVADFSLTLYGYNYDTVSYRVESLEGVTPEIRLTHINLGMPGEDVIPENFMRTGGRSITTFKIQ